MDYDKYKIKEYIHWDLFLHENQFPYLGRCYAWAKRESANKITDMTNGELTELFDVIVPAWDRTIKTLFQHDWPNVAVLGNETPHLHAYLIPRYNTPREFHGVTFIDPNPKGNYSPYPKLKLEENVLQEIKQSILNTI